jgi:hypothetical protein
MLLLGRIVPSLHKTESGKQNICKSTSPQPEHVQAIVRDPGLHFRFQKIGKKAWSARIGWDRENSAAPRSADLRP